MSTLPEGPEQTVTTTRKWRIDEVKILRDLDGDGIRVEVFDRLIVNEEPTSERRLRKLSEEEADQLWGLPARTLPAFIDLIHQNAEE